MHKIITTAALLAAGTALASAATVSLTPETLRSISSATDYSGKATYITRPASTDLTLTLGGVTKKGSTQSNIDVSATDVASKLNGNPGWYFGSGTGNTSIGWSWISDGSGSFSITGRPAYRGTYIASVISLDSLWTNFGSLSDISVSFDAASNKDSDSNFKFTAWSLDSTGTATQLNADFSTPTLGASKTTVSFSADNLALTSENASKIVLLFSSGVSSAEYTTTVSGLSVSATASPVPEPSAFGLLAGIGALALVAARRRRK